MWLINCLEMLAVFQTLKHFLPDLRGHNVLVRIDNTSVVSYILRSRYPVERPMGMEAPHPSDGADLEEVWLSPGGFVCISRALPMSLLVLSNSPSSIGAGCLGTDVAEALSLSVCLFHNGLNAIVPLHVLRNCGAHELLWCDYYLLFIYFIYLVI